MNKISTIFKTLLLCCIGFLFLLSSCSDTGDKNQKNTKNRSVPTNLTIDFIRDPEKTVIDNGMPVLSWEVPVEATFQKAFQILLSTNKKQIDKDTGDIWDSGVVNSAKSSNIKIEANLKPNTTYYWKVRILDENEVFSNFSALQEFKTGDNYGNDFVVTENYFMVEKIEPKSIEQMADGNWFVDFGKAAFGTVELNYKSKSNDSITIHLGEKLLNGKIDRNPGGSIRYQKITVAVTPKESQYLIDLIPDERNTNKMAIALPDSFPVIMPFRYAEVENIKKLTKNSISQIAYFDYFDYNTSAFNSSDDILNQVWDLCKYSMKATSFTGYYVDGDRERIPYEADAYINQLSHYAVDNEYAIGRRTMEYFVDHPTWPTEWQLHFILLFYYDYLYTGNTQMIEKHYETMKIKSLLDLRREDGLISSHNASKELLEKLGFDTTNPRTRMQDIVDWPPANKDVSWELATEEGERDGFIFMPYNTVVNSFFCENIRILSYFAEILGKDTEAKEFKELYNQVREVINKNMFDTERGVYVDGEGTDHASLHANMLPLAFNLVPEERVESVVNFIKSRGMACSVYGSQYLMEGLYRAKEDDYALELMTATHDRSWYNTIKVGSTITFEAWDMKYKPNADWNHAWGATPANIIARFLWGINPEIPGFDSVTIQPQLSTLENSEITFPTIKGEIKCKFNKTNANTQDFLIELPGNIRGEFRLDLPLGKSITINNKSFNHEIGTAELLPGKNKIVVKTDN